MSTLFQKLLDFYSMSEESYSEWQKLPALTDLPSFLDYPEVIIARDYILETIKNHEKIVVYGDYDCDGIMATSILKKTFNLLNYQIGYYIPSRTIDGYGLNKAKVQEFHEKNYKLIITVDNGVSAHEAIELAYELGMKVIITDHHSLRETIPPHVALLHSNSTIKTRTPISGAFVALILSAALLNHYDEYLVALASIAVLSDSMLLENENLTLLKLGLGLMNVNHYLPLDLVLTRKKEVINSEDLSFLVIPKINAVGRVIEGRTINQLIPFFAQEEKIDNIKISQYIAACNESRKEETTRILTKIEPPLKESNEAAIVKILEVKEGLAGLIATRLASDLGKPVAIFTSNPEKTLFKGSCRSKEGFSIIEAFEKLRPFIDMSGGHQYAGGLTVNKSNFIDFKNGFIELAKGANLPKTMPLKNVIALDAADFTFDNVNLIATFGPFGHGHSAPSFSYEVEKEKFRFSKDSRHLIFDLMEDVKVVCFNHSLDLAHMADRYLMCGNLLFNIFKAKTTINFQVDDIRAL